MDVQYQKDEKDGKAPTPEMLEAGGDVIERWGSIYPQDELAGLVFRAMLDLAPGSGTQGTCQGR